MRLFADRPGQDPRHVGGGPVYWGNTALGVVAGRSGTDGIYTAINFVQSSDMGLRCVQKSNKTY